MPDTPFSCFGKKRAKRSRLKEALRTNAPSLRIHPPHRHPAFKNVPIFERFHDTNLQDCSAEPAENRDIFSGRWSNAAGVGSGARMLLARNASPRTTSLVTFLFGHKKVTPIGCPINSNLTTTPSYRAVKSAAERTKDTSYHRVLPGRKKSSAECFSRAFIFLTAAYRPGPLPAAAQDTPGS